MRRAVFLDRDGVLNRTVVRDGKPYPPQSLAELRVLPGVREGCRRLREAGFALILVTNQPDIARGTASRSEVMAMNQRLQRFLQIDDVRMCEHDDHSQCPCRKPKPGLLTDAARAWNIDLAASYVIGDRWRDIEAGHRAGCQTIFIDYGYREQQPAAPFWRVRGLREAAEWIMRTAPLSLEHVF
jgi:D-glycero-D-manno-heptose 1,7-bisphosphate phosphatase